MVVLFQFLGGLSLGLIALALQTPLWFAACVAVLFVAALASSTHDIVCDGLYIASLSRQAAGGLRGLAGRLFQRRQIHLAGRPGDPGRLPGKKYRRQAGLVGDLPDHRRHDAVAGRVSPAGRCRRCATSAVADKSVAGISRHAVGRARRLPEKARHLGHDRLYHPVSRRRSAGADHRPAVPARSARAGRPGPVDHRSGRRLRHGRHGRLFAGQHRRRLFHFVAGPEARHARS